MVALSSSLQSFLVINAVYIPRNRKLLDAGRDRLDFAGGHDGARTCEQCPAGTHQSQSCDTPGTKATCTPCTDGVDYTEFDNNLTHCLSCSRCKSGHEEVSGCSTIRNTQCRCKAGTFCPDDHPCEACLRCKTSCPEGEAFISPCNATADTQCAQPTGPPATKDHKAWILPVVLLPVIFIVFIIYCVYKKRNQKSSVGGRSDSLCGSYSSPVLMFKRYRHNSRTQETRDNTTNSSRDTAADPFLPRGEDHEEMRIQGRQGVQVEGQPTDNEHPKDANGVLYNLIAVGGNETEALRNAFDVFIKNVPTEKWSFFMRKLDLTDIDIEMVNADYRSGGTEEARFQMLRKWRDQADVNLRSVNTLLQALHDLELQYISMNISDRLLERNLYKPLQAS